MRIAVGSRPIVTEARSNSVRVLRICTPGVRADKCAIQSQASARQEDIHAIRVGWSDGVRSNIEVNSHPRQSARCLCIRRISAGTTHTSSPYSRRGNGPYLLQTPQSPGMGQIVRLVLQLGGLVCRKDARRSASRCSANALVGAACFADRLPTSGATPLPTFPRVSHQVCHSTHGPDTFLDQSHHREQQPVHQQLQQ